MLCLVAQATSSTIKNVRRGADRPLSPLRQDGSSSRDGWSQSSSDSSAGSRSDAAVMLPLPSVRLPSPSTSSPPSEAAEDIGATIPTGKMSTAGWLQSSSVLGALISTEQTTVESGDGLVDGVVVRIAPHFSITSTSLLSQRGQSRLLDASIVTRAVVFGDEVVEVNNVYFESDYYHSSKYSLVVLEHKQEPTPSAPVVPIVTSKPNSDFEYEMLSIVDAISVLDSKALQLPGVVGRALDEPLATTSKLTFFVEPMCGFAAPAAQDSDGIKELCVGQLARSNRTSFFDVGSQHRVLYQAHLKTNHTNNSATIPSLLRPNTTAVSNPHRPKNPGLNGSTPTMVGSSVVKGQVFALPAVLLYDGKLVGISIPVKTAAKPFASAEDSKRGFLRLAAPEHRAFIDAATGQTAVYDDDDVFSKLSKYPSYLATFVNADGEQLSCQGVLVAAKYVLTTASCLAAEPGIRAVQFFASDAKQRQTVNVVPSRMASHPRYTAGDVTFDTALVALETAVALAPIQLDDGSTNDSARFARIQLSGDQCVISAIVAATKTNADAACRNRDGNKIKTSEALCLVAMDPVDTAARFSVRDFVGDDSVATVAVAPPPTTGAALVTVSSLSSVVLVGLAVPAMPPTADSAVGRRRDLQTTSSEVYVRVATSATFINAYVTGISWNIPMAMVADVAEQLQLPTAELFVVGLRSTRDGQNFCGGSLVGSTSVLTAAHCVVDGPVHYVSIGAHASSGVESEVIAVLKTQIHPHYGRPHNFSHDVAILELEYASAVKPVLLDDTVDFTAQETATMFGYGMTSATSGLSASLREVTMPLWSRAACREVFGDEVDDSMLCAGGQKGKDACSGDSGSPLVLSRSGVNVLVGVVSAGSGCGVENVPGVYARVYNVKEFLLGRVIGASWWADPTTDANQAGSPSSATSGTVTPLPTAVIEAREANDTSTGGGSMSTPSSSPPASSAPGPGGAYNVAQIGLTALSPLVSESLMDFLLGSDSEQVMAAGMIQALKSSGNVLTLYSTGDLNGFMAVVARHNASPLNQRSDRFGRWKDEYAGGSLGGCVAQKEKGRD